MKQYRPVGLTTKEDNFSDFVVDNFNAISSVINNLNTETQLTNQSVRKVAVDGANSTGSNSEAIATNSADITTNTSNIGTNTTNIGTNTTNIGTNTTSIGTNATNISTNSSDITDLQNRSTRSELYNASDVTGPLANPSATRIAIDVGGKEIKISKEPLGGAPNVVLDNIIKVQLYSDKALAHAFRGLTVVDNTTYYTITATISAGTGSWSVSDIVNVTFHW